MEYVFLRVAYDPALVTPEFMAGLVLELEGVGMVKIKAAD